MEKTSGAHSAASNSWTTQEATLEHLDAIIALEEACFSVPWSKKSFEAELAGNQFSRVHMIVNPEQGRKVEVIGYICAWLIFEELRFLNVAVHPDFRRQGLARQLILKVLRLGEEAGCCRGLLEVREANAPAINLYKHFNFHAYATRKSYYTNPTEDAILMTLEPLIPLQTERSDERKESIGSQTTIHTIS
jgi:ribosomal-protein-alanine N-acetyltransferase